jgi:uroporphyrinogen-III decarboxylase
MKPSQFDFPRFQDWAAGREERMHRFLEGKSETNLVLLEKEFDNFLICRTPQGSLEIQLDMLTRQMELESDYVPYLEPWFGVGVYANAFGAEYIWMDGESAQTHYIVFNEEQAARLDKPSIEDSPVMKLVLEAIDYFVEETHGLIPIACTDTQSPLDTITLLWDTASFFTATYTAPEVVHGLLQKITDLIVEFSRCQVQHMGNTWAQPGHIMPSARGSAGLSISDDNIVMVSPKHYAAFAVPYNTQIASAFGGLAVHSCGDYFRQLPEILKTPGLLVLDGAFSEELDPNPNRNISLFRDLLKGSGVILQARVGADWPELLPRLYHPDLRLALTVPVPAPGEPNDINMRKLMKVMEKI